jgi:hypothetical protein
LTRLSPPAGPLACLPDSAAATPPQVRVPPEDCQALLCAACGLGGLRSLLLPQVACTAAAWRLLSRMPALAWAHLRSLALDGGAHPSPVKCLELEERLRLEGAAAAQPTGLLARLMPDLLALQVEACTPLSPPPSIHTH